MTYDLALQINDLTKQYSTSKGPFLALNKTSLQVPSGSYFGLLGPNGAGKSTIINILAGITNKTSGRIIISGLDQDLFPKKIKYRIGIVPQEIALDVFLPIRQMLSIYSGFYGKKISDKEINILLSDLGLIEKADLTSRALSGGMKRRLLIAKAMIHKPKILILDEPSAGVDIKLRKQIWDYTKILNKQGTTIILTTHYLEEAEKLCNHIAFINKGKIIHSDSKDNLLEMFASKEVIIQFAQKVCLYDIKKFIHRKCELQGINDYTLRILFSTKDITTQEILSVIQKLDIEIVDMTIMPPQLESVFSQLIET